MFSARFPFSFRILTFAGLAAAVTLAACSKPEKVVERFCDRHRQAEFGMAWDLLSKDDKAGITKKDYADFEWDQKTFDLRILRSHETCEASMQPLGEAEALGTITLGSRMHGRTMSCVVPMVKQGSSWKVTRSWAPMEELLTTIATARKALMPRLQGKVDLDAEAWGKSASAALADYWTAIDGPMAKVKTLAGGEVPTFCHGPLNLDGGSDLVFDYMGFQEVAKVQKKPKHLVEGTQMRAKLVDVLRQEYKPLASLVHDGTRLDLISAKVGDGSDGDVSKDEVRTLMVVWGEVKSPLFWKLYVYEKGELTNEGNGTPIDILTDAVELVPDAPPLKLAVFEFPRMPAGTDKLELELVDDAEKHEYMVPIPVAPEFITQG